MRSLRPAIWLASAVLGFAAALAPAPATAITSDYSRTPILMIHGYFVIDNAGDATWSTMRKHLVEDGWPLEYISTPSFNDVRGCNADHLNEIEAWVEDLRKRTGFDTIDIVCHSFGCLNTLSWLKEKCGMNRVRQFVGLAGAVHGTWVACADDAVGLSCAGHEMCIDTGTDGWKSNQLIVDTNACDGTPGNVQYTTVWSDYDEIIRPPSGAEMVGATNIEVDTPWVEHGGIFLCDECYDHMRTALTEGGSNLDGPSWECTPDCTPPEIADPTPEPIPDAGTDAGVGTDLAAADAVANDLGSDETGIADTATTDTGTTPDRGTGELSETDVSAVDVPSSIPEDLPPPSPKGGGCAAGPGSPTTAPWGIAFLALCLAMRRRRLRG